MANEIKEIREYISCPQFGDDHYGKWGALTLEQRATIYDLINIVECDDIEIKRLKQEIIKLNKIIDELENYLITQIRHTDKEYIFGEVYHKLKELKEEGK